MAYWSRLVSGKNARFVMYKNITVCIEANKYLLLLLRKKLKPVDFICLSSKKINKL